MNRLLLVDGHNLLFKAFYGVPEKLLPDGRPIHGVIGFVSMMNKIINLTEPSHVLTVFDPEEKPSRATLYQPYKQNRHDYGEMPDRENPFSQLAGIKKALDCLHIKYIEQTGHEADDMIASYASQVPCQAVIASTDTDLLQLICERITMFRYHWKNSMLFTESVVQEKFGVHPTNFLEYKSLIGDKTDNIGGIKGIGPKTAIKVLNGQRTLSGEEREIFERNLKLIRLDSKVELPFALSELSFSNTFNQSKGFKVYEYLHEIRVL
ncbi:MAG: 5'-3' exonuclease [Chloroflexi bacterium]|nr:5'-3' exonuclease [Chloroflexota bacterium]